MPPPLVSICIPCFNGGLYVAEAVESALGQTHPNTEVIVVDDGSTDGSVDVLRSFGNRIRWETGPNRGACAARNRALELSRGEYINFLDSDDVLETRKVELQTPPLARGEADVVLSKVGLLWPAPRPPAPEKKPHPAPEGDPFIYFARYPIGTAPPLHRRCFLERAGGFREGLSRGQEYDLHLRLGLLGVRLAMIDEILVWVRMHEGPRVSASAVRPQDQLRTRLAMAMDFRQSIDRTKPRRQLVARMLRESAIQQNHRDALVDKAASMANQLDPNPLRQTLHWLRSLRHSGQIER